MIGIVGIVVIFVMVFGGIELLFGLMGNQRNPADWTVVGDSLQVEPYACMLRKDDPQFQALVNGVIGGMMKSGEFDKLYTK